MGTEVGFICSETELLVWDFMPRTQIAAATEWLRFHDIDPLRIPRENLIRRDVAGCRVEYTEYIFDEHDQVVVLDGEAQTRLAYSQGEAPPLPWPAELTSTEPSAEGAME